MSIEQLSVLDLQMKIEELKKALDTKIRSERKEVIEKIQDLVRKYDLTADEVFSTKLSSTPAAVRKVEPKYRDPITGATWTGRGITPKWIIDKNREDFLINKPAEVPAAQGELPVSN